VTVIVNDQKKTHGSKIDFKVVKVGEGDSAAEIKKAKLARHGIVAKDSSGKLLTKVDGHSYGKDKVVEVIDQLLAKPKKGDAEG
jgi:hypothetical protein